MSYTAAEFYPSNDTLTVFNWPRPEAPRPALSGGINSTASTIIVNIKPLGLNAVLIQKGFLMGIENLTTKYSEIIYVPPFVDGVSGVQADGFTLMGCVRGIRPEGLDFTTGDPTYASEHPDRSKVYCAVAQTYHRMMIAALQGEIGTGSDTIKIGRKEDEDVWFEIDRPGGGDPIRWGYVHDATPPGFFYTDDGTNYFRFGDGAGIAPGPGLKLLSGVMSVDLEDTDVFVSEGSGPSVAGKAIVLDEDGLVPVSFLRPEYTIFGTLGDAVSSGDITSNNNLVYQLVSDGKWYKVTNSAPTWYKKLGLVLEDGIANDSVRILLEGEYQNQTFANINPTFSSSGTGVTQALGADNATTLVSFLIDNTNGAEFQISGGDIRARQNGTPSGAMLVNIVLDQLAEQNTYPACFSDETNDVVRGAVIGSTSIAQALFSGTYANMPFTFSQNVKIPAGARAHLVLRKAGDVNASNFYQLDVQAASALLAATTQTWSGAENAGNIRLTTVSTSPIGYSVKAYNGSNGSYGLLPSGNPWAKVIGRVLSPTSFYFDPDENLSSTNFVGYGLSATAAGGLATIETGFCPSQVKIDLVWQKNNSTPADAEARFVKARIRGDILNAATFRPSAFGQSGQALDAFSSSEVPSNIIGNDAVAMDLNLGGGVQNKVYLARLENGFYMYNGFPAGANFISGGTSGYSNLVASVQFESKV